MLAKRYRLSATFFKNRSLVRLEKRENDFFAVRRYRSPLANSRFAVVVSKKVAPRAVTRTRVRRMIYDYVRVFRGWERPGGDVVVMVKKSMVGDDRHLRDALAKGGGDLL